MCNVFKYACYMYVHQYYFIIDILYLHLFMMHNMVVIDILYLHLFTIHNMVVLSAVMHVIDLQHKFVCY